AVSLWMQCTPVADAPGSPKLAVVASSLADLQEELTVSASVLRSEQESLHDPRGIFFAHDPAAHGGKIAFLFPGQGSQYPNMLAQTAMAFPTVRQMFDQATHELRDCLE